MLRDVGEVAAGKLSRGGMPDLRRNLGSPRNHASIEDTDHDMSDGPANVVLHVLTVLGQEPLTCGRDVMKTPSVRIHYKPRGLADRMSIHV